MRKALKGKKGAPLCFGDDEQICHLGWVHRYESRDNPRIVVTIYDPGKEDPYEHVAQHTDPTLRP